MRDQAFAELSPQLADRYLALLDRELAGSPELDGLHRMYRDYAVRDRHLPRPVLAYFGYHATSDNVDFTDLPGIGDGLPAGSSPNCSPKTTPSPRRASMIFS